MGTAEEYHHLRAPLSLSVSAVHENAHVVNMGIFVYVGGLTDPLKRC